MSEININVPSTKFFNQTGKRLLELLTKPDKTEENIQEINELRRKMAVMGNKPMSVSCCENNEQLSCGEDD